MRPNRDGTCHSGDARSIPAPSIPTQFPRGAPFAERSVNTHCAKRAWRGLCAPRRRGGVPCAHDQCVSPKPLAPFAPSAPAFRLPQLARPIWRIIPYHRIIRVTASLRRDAATKRSIKPPLPPSYFTPPGASYTHSPVTLLTIPIFEHIKALRFLSLPLILKTSSLKLPPLFSPSSS